MNDLPTAAEQAALAALRRWELATKLAHDFVCDEEDGGQSELAAKADQLRADLLLETVRAVVEAGWFTSCFFWKRWGEGGGERADELVLAGRISGARVDRGGVYLMVTATFCDDSGDLRGRGLEVQLPDLLAGLRNGVFAISSSELSASTEMCLSDINWKLGRPSSGPAREAWDADQADARRKLRIVAGEPADDLPIAS